MIGSEISSARRRSCSSTSSNAFSIVPAPASCSVTPACARPTSATAASIGATCSFASSGSPRRRDLDERGAAAGGRQRRVVDGPDLAQPVEAGDQRRARGRGGGRIAGAHEDALGSRGAQAGSVDPGVRPGRLAGAGLRAGEGLDAGQRAGEQAARDEDEPEGDGGARPPGRRGGDMAHECHGRHRHTAAPCGHWGAEASPLPPAPVRARGLTSWHEPALCPYLRPRPRPRSLRALLQRARVRAAGAPELRLRLQRLHGPARGRRHARADRQSRPRRALRPRHGLQPHGHHGRGHPRRAGRPRAARRAAREAARTTRATARSCR